MFGKHCHHRNPATAASDTAALFSRYDRKLRDRVSAVVNTSQANIEGACMFAWVQFLRCELDEVDAAYSWLTTVAIREAIKLDRADRRTRPLPVDEHGAVIEPIDPRDELAARDLLDHAAAVIQQAGLTDQPPAGDDLPAGVGTDPRADLRVHWQQPPHGRAPDPAGPRQARRGAANQRPVRTPPSRQPATCSATAGALGAQRS